MTGSRQQSEYLRLRFGTPPMPLNSAAFEAGIPWAEAKAIDQAVERGELAHPVQTGGNYSDPIPDTPPAAESAAHPEENVNMARPKKDEGPKVTNLSAAKDLIRNAVPEIINIEDKIKNLRDRKNELRSAVQAAGVPKAAFDYAMKVRKMEPDVRQAFDEGYVIAREATGLRVNRGLFEALESDEPEPEEDAPTRMSDGNGAAYQPPDDDSDLNDGEHEESIVERLAAE